MEISFKVKRMMSILLLMFLIVLAAKFVYYEYWLNSSSSTPKEAILKYCSKHGLTYLPQNVNIQETNIVDTNYGKQFTVDGVIGEFGGSIHFFYLKDTEGRWNVVTAGTGP